MNKKLKRVLFVLVMTNLILGFIHFVLFFIPYKLAFNIGDCLPGKVFIIFENEIPRKNEMIAFWPPHTSKIKKIWFVKILKGTSGDKVAIKSNRIFINHEDLGIVKVKTQDGKKINPIQNTNIRNGKYFVWTSHKDSYDSRYEEIGLIDRHQIIGRAVRLF
jgi:conjugal transfer pilin signal peptidase TrbI